MSDVVFILGAGASREAGGPLMHDFLDIADGLLRSGKVKEDSASFEAVMKGIGALQQVHSKSQLEITNLESVFATFEMAQILGKLPGYDSTQLDELIFSMKTLIVKTLAKTIKFPKTETRFFPPKPYNKLAEIISLSTTKVSPPRSVSVITFNYDMAIDYTLYFNKLSPNYSFDNASSQGIPLLKLHGSLNWGKCSVCNKIVPWDLAEFFKKYKWDPHTIEIAGYLDIDVKLSDLNHCDQQILPDPLLVPPTWNKFEYHNSLANVWSRAAQELGDAEYIFVIGYSLPDSDQFFRHLYALGSVGPKPLKAFWVFDPDKTGVVKERFEKILGPAAKSCFKYICCEFSGAVGVITNKISEYRKI